MKIAIINETSAADKNADILAALEGRDHELFNVGMKERGAQPELLYIHTGLMSALLFTQINGGNCISLALNQGYGWAGDVNLRFIFDRIFSVESGTVFEQRVEVLVVGNELQVIGPRISIRSR